MPATNPVGDERTEHICYGIYPSPLLRITIDASLSFDPAMRLHLLATNKMAWQWGEVLELDETERYLFAEAALLHDVGKVLLPRRIILKPTKLTDAEYAIVRQHVPLGVALVKMEPGFDPIAKLVGQHHEWFDGSGYPEGRARNEIEPLARALSIIDAYSAMTDERPYHVHPHSSEGALQELERYAGSQFDPKYVESFVAFRRALDARNSLQRHTA